MTYRIITVKSNSGSKTVFHTMLVKLCNPNCSQKNYNPLQHSPSVLCLYSCVVVVTLPFLIQAMFIQVFDIKLRFDSTTLHHL